MTQSIRLLARPWATHQVADYLKQCTGMGYKTRWTQGLGHLEREFVLSGQKFELDQIKQDLTAQAETWKEE